MYTSHPLYSRVTYHKANITIDSIASRRTIAKFMLKRISGLFIMAMLFCRVSPAKSVKKYFFLQWTPLTAVPKYTRNAFSTYYLPPLSKLWLESFF